MGAMGISVALCVYINNIYIYIYEYIQIHTCAFTSIYLPVNKQINQ